MSLAPRGSTAQVSARCLDLEAKRASVTDSFLRRDVLARCGAGCIAECGETVVCSW